MTSVDRVAEGSETIATEENCPPHKPNGNPFPNSNPITNRGGGGSFPRGSIVRTPLQSN